MTLFRAKLCLYFTNHESFESSSHRTCLIFILILSSLPHIGLISVLFRYESLTNIPYGYTISYMRATCRAQLLRLKGKDFFLSTTPGRRMEKLRLAPKWIAYCVIKHTDKPLRCIRFESITRNAKPRPTTSRIYESSKVTPVGLRFGFSELRLETGILVVRHVVNARGLES
jgi:hypothetical protein